MTPNDLGTSWLELVDGQLRMRDIHAPLHLTVHVDWWNGVSSQTSAGVGAWSLHRSVYYAAAGPWRIALCATQADVGCTLRLSVSFLGDGASPPLRGVRVGAHGFAARRGSGRTVALRIAYCGAHSRSYTSRSLTRTIEDGEEERGWWVGALSGARGPAIVLGAESVARFVTEFIMRTDSIEAYQHCEHWKLAAGEAVELEPLWLATTETAPLEALEIFATRLASAHDAHPGDAPCGWGSWGHWLERIDLGLIRETLFALDGIASLREVVRLVQIDDGWSELLESGRVSASWRPNRRFPSGIAPLAAEIRRTGRECGLWLLPFTVNSGSSIVEQHPEWLVAATDGTPFLVGGIESYCLDPTHPGAAAWLRNVFSKMRDWGVRYVKLDHMRALLAPDPECAVDGFDTQRIFHGTRTRVEAYRAGLRLVRDAMGDDVVLVGCSAPAAAGTGLVNTHRVGPDIEPRWTGHTSGVRDAARSLIANWFWQGRTWVNDPDYLLPCDTETHTRFWATVVALSGGSAVLSADLAQLHPWAERILSFVIPPIGISARPVDLFEHGPEPRVLHLPFERKDERWHMVGLLNWDDQPRQHELDLQFLGIHGPVHVWDAWRQTHRIADGSIRVPLEGHDAALLRITPVQPRPQIVGTNVHWAQGWLELESQHWSAATGSFVVHSSDNVKRSGHVWVFSSEHFVSKEDQPHVATLLRLDVRPSGRYVLQFRPIQSHSLKIES